MKMEYPEYYERFECIAGACTDSCCARWEIDVDDESYYYYQTVQGDFGERIRGCLHEEVTEGEDGPEYEWSFPLTPDRRCPFLNDADLCDMYTALGHDRLPRTCREFPRGDAVVGNYHQIDVAVACPEANRLIFEDLEHPIKYVMRDEPTGVPALDRYCATEEPKLDNEEMGRLFDLLEERNQLMEVLQDTSYPLRERYGVLFQLATEYGGQRRVLNLMECHEGITARIPHSADIYQSATGRIILAYYPEHKIREIVSRVGLPSHETWEGIDSVDALLEGLAEIREKGISTTIFREHMLGVAVPVLVGGWPIASIGMCLPRCRCSEPRLGIIHEVLGECATSIAEKVRSAYYSG